MKKTKSRILIFLHICVLLGLASLAAAPSVVQSQNSIPPGCVRNDMQNAKRPYTCPGDSSSANQGPSQPALQRPPSSGQNTQQIINALGALSASMDRIRAQERADRERREAEEAERNERRQQWRAENERRQAEEAEWNERRQQQEAENERLQRQASAIGQPAPSNSQVEPKTKPLDPNADYDGKECKYFTKPAIEAHGARLNYYADGATVVYGAWIYRCVSRRWVRQGDGSRWPSQYWAEKIEASKLNTAIYVQD